MKKSFFTLFLCALAYLGFGQALKVAADGNVGVGNSSPIGNLEISSASNPELRLSENSSAGSYTRIGDFSANQVKIEKVAASSYSLIDINPKVTDGSSSAWFRFFRETNTSGAVRFLVYKGDNSQDVNSQFGGNTDSYLNAQVGNVGIGKSSTPAHKLDVEGDAYKTVGGDLWNMASDRKLKRNIRPLEDGLEYILKMKPVTYEYNGKLGTKDGEFQVGVVAQDLQEVAPFMVQKATYKEVKTNARGVDEIAFKEDFLTMNASAVKWMLVAAVQEQQEIISAQEREIEEMSERLSKIEELLESSNALGSNIVPNTNVVIDGSRLARLEQNAPNPFNGTTTISYEIPLSSESAQVLFHNTNGQVLKEVQLDHTGQGTITFEAKDVPAGTYSYSLVIDGKQFATKQMVLMR